jgi:hypothetical protein
VPGNETYTTLSHTTLPTDISDLLKKKKKKKNHRNKFRKYLLLFSSKPLTISSAGTFTIPKRMIYKTTFPVYFA